MTWIDDRLAERAMRDKRTELILSNAEEIFNNLWKEIKRSVDEAKSKQLPVSANGSPYERVILIPDPIQPPRAAFGEEVSRSPVSKRLRVKLEKDASEITVDGPPHKIAIDVCDDNVVCLKINGKPTSLPDAARAILDPFLFPELNEPEQG